MLQPNELFGQPSIFPPGTYLVKHVVSQYQTNTFKIPAVYSLFFFFLKEHLRKIKFGKFAVFVYKPDKSHAVCVC